MTAFAARTRPGPPENGRYQVLDTVPDSNGVVWQCSKGGMAAGSQFYADKAEWVALPPVTAVSPFGVGTPAGTGVASETTGSGPYRRTVLTLTAMPQTITNGASEFTGTKIYDFPEGRILILGVIATLAETTTSVLATTITTATAGAYALGTVTASNASLTGTMVNLAPSTAYTSSATINVPGAAAVAALAASAPFDGTATAIDMFLNNSIATNSADGTLTWTGRIEVAWVHLGDY